ncbi:acyltransferase family protein [Brucella tritici]|uniref:acyltransferase family protein n=1 Tax=Brucella tritici TaxID=94626 RepID=UPI00178C67CC|nr:acyltransferase [Brucella tritici]
MYDNENQVGVAVRKNLVVQALRGIAAISVVIFHASLLLDDLSTDAKQSIFGPLAPFGVDIFFLISGYIIAASVSRYPSGGTSAGLFLMKRLIRIWPPYAIATAIFCAAYALKNGTAPVFPELLRSLAFIQLSDEPPYYGFASLVVGWTLNYEMFFYVVMALVLLLPRWRWQAAIAIFLTALVLIPLTIQPGLSIYQLIDAGRADANAYVITNPLCWLFALGALVHFIEQRGFSLRSKAATALFTSASIFFLIYCYGSPGMNGHGLTGMGLAVFPLFIVAVLARKQIERYVPKWLVFSGDISFSVYLTHIIVLSIAKAALTPFGVTGLWLMMSAIAASLTAGALYYSFIERPLTRWLSSRAAGAAAGRMAAVR